MSDVTCCVIQSTAFFHLLSKVEVFVKASCKRMRKWEAEMEKTSAKDSTTRLQATSQWEGWKISHTKKSLTILIATQMTTLLGILVPMLTIVTAIIPLPARHCYWSSTTCWPTHSNTSAWHTGICSRCQWPKYRVKDRFQHPSWSKQPFPTR